jgi:hypothetical protein
MKLLHWLIISSLGLLAAVAWLPAAAPPTPLRFAPYPEITPRGYVCGRASGPIRVDGKLNEASWADAPWSEEFVDIEGDRRPRPRFRTRMKMLWDDENLYIAAQMEEPHVWATLTEHDSVIFHDNDFEVFIDPDGDSHLYAELEVNALNTTWDLLLTRPYKDQGHALDAWEATGLKTAVLVDGTLNDPRDRDKGWTVEIAWPWKSLKELSSVKTPPGDQDQWRINFSRVEWRHEVAGGKYRRVKGLNEDNWVWSPQGVVDMHRPERWGVVQFSTQPPGKARFQPLTDLKVRHLLHEVYYRQKAFHAHRGKWAADLESLRLGGPEFGAVRLEGTSSRFEASASGKSGRWRITEDARIVRE